MSYTHRSRALLGVYTRVYVHVPARLKRLQNAKCWVKRGKKYKNTKYRAYGCFVGWALSIGVIQTTLIVLGGWGGRFRVSGACCVGSAGTRSDIPLSGRCMWICGRIKSHHVTVKGPRGVSFMRICQGKPEKKCHARMENRSCAGRVFFWFLP